MPQRKHHHHFTYEVLLLYIKGGLLIPSMSSLLLRNAAAAPKVIAIWGREGENELSSNCVQKWECCRYCKTRHHHRLGMVPTATTPTIGRKGEEEEEKGCVCAHEPLALDGDHHLLPPPPPPSSQG